MHTLETYTHETHPERLAPDERVRLVPDTDYQTIGSYAYDTEEETRAAEDHELDMLERHEWVVLGRIVERRCPHCDSWTQTDSLWGMVVDNSTAGYLQAAFDI